MRKPSFIVGKRFGKLFVLSQSDPINHLAASVCVCDCGKKVVVLNKKLHDKTRRSCGCERQRILKKGCCFRHGMRHSKAYYVWTAMKQRCLNPKHRAWPDYGGRGITVSQRWLKFENFLADMGQLPDGLTLERKNNDLGYAKENCEWVTVRQQSFNRRNTRFVTVRGVTACFAVHAINYGVDYGTANNRYRLGWPLEVIFPAKGT